MPLKRPMHRRNDIIKMDIARNSIGNAAWADVVEDREKVADSLERGDQPSGFIKCGGFID